MQDRSRALVDIVFGTLLIVLAGVVWASVAQLPPPFFDSLGSAAFPKALAAIIALLSCIVLAQGAMAWRASEPSEREPLPYRQRFDLAVGFIVLTVLYAAVMEFDLLGFAWATTLFVFAGGTALGRFRLRETILSAAIAVLLGFGGWYLFTQVFYIDLPA